MSLLGLNVAAADSPSINTELQAIDERIQNLSSVGKLPDTAITYATQNANKVLASPDTATATKGTPSFRALTSTDIPSLDASKITTGSLSDSRLSSNVALLNRNAQSWTGTSNTFGGNVIVSAPNVFAAKGTSNFGPNGAAASTDVVSVGSDDIATFDLKTSTANAILHGLNQVTNFQVDNAAGNVTHLSHAGTATKCYNSAASGAHTATVTNVHSIYAHAPTKDANTTVTNAYAGYFEAPSIGATINESIHAVGKVTLDDALALSSSSAGSIKELGRSTALGFGITPSFSAGDYTANGSMTWTLTSGDVTTLRYFLIGKLMFIDWHLVTTTVGGTPNTQLLIKIPGSFTAAGTFRGVQTYSDNGAAKAIGGCFVTNGATNISLVKIDTSNWTAATDTTESYGQMFFEVT